MSRYAFSEARLLTTPAIIETGSSHKSFPGKSASVECIREPESGSTAHDVLRLSITSTVPEQFDGVVVFVHDAQTGGILKSEKLLANRRNPTECWAIIHRLPTDRPLKIVLI